MHNFSPHVYEHNQPSGNNSNDNTGNNYHHYYFAVDRIGRSIATLLASENKELFRISNRNGDLMPWWIFYTGYLAHGINKSENRRRIRYQNNSNR